MSKLPKIIIISACVCVLGFTFIPSSSGLNFETSFTSYATNEVTTSGNLVSIYNAAQNREQSAIQLHPEFGLVDGEWYISTGPNDQIGNAMSIYNFFMYAWPDAYTWLTENSKPIDDDGYKYRERDPLTFSETFPIAIVANAFRESECRSSLLQNNRGIYDDMTAEECLNHLLSLNTVGGKAFGLFQWDTDRRLELVRWCQVNDFDPREAWVQLYFLAYEYYGSSGMASNWTGYWRTDTRLIDWTNKELSLENCIETAEVFRTHWERGGQPGPNEGILKVFENKWESSWGPKPSWGLYDCMVEAITTGRLWDGTTLEDRGTSLKQNS